MKQLKVKCLVNGNLKSIEMNNHFRNDIKGQAKLKIALAAKFENSEIIIL